MRTFINIDLESRTLDLNVLPDMEVGFASLAFLAFCISDTGYCRCKKLSRSKYNIPPSENYRLMFYFFTSFIFIEITDYSFLKF